MSFMGRIDPMIIPPEYVREPCPRHVPVPGRIRHAQRVAQNEKARRVVPRRALFVSVVSRARIGARCRDDPSSEVDDCVDRTEIGGALVRADTGSSSQEVAISGAPWTIDDVQHVVARGVAVVGGTVDGMIPTNFRTNLDLR
jgi:hypothetical protein